jgi:hypothetical protein
MDAAIEITIKPAYVQVSKLEDLMVHVTYIADPATAVCCMFCSIPSGRLWHGRVVAAQDVEARACGCS